MGPAASNDLATSAGVDDADAAAGAGDADRSGAAAAADVDVDAAVETAGGLHATGGPHAAGGLHAAGDMHATGDAASVDEALALVRAHGGRVTSARRLLLAALFASRDHRSAEELAAEVQAQAPDVALSTIYRNLEELERLGVIDRTPLGRGPAAYHLASAAHGHGHFVCEGCGRMIEVPHDLFRGLADTARAHYGFVIDPHRFAVVGACADCAAEA